jgi:predicted HTH transcriptional regulator
MVSDPASRPTPTGSDTIFLNQPKPMKANILSAGYAAKNAKTLSKLIGSDESTTVEWKPSLSQINEIIESIAAFSNTEGGRLFIGISKNGEIAGVSIGRDTIENLANRLAQHTEPKVQPRITVKKIDGKESIIGQLKNAEEVGTGTNKIIKWCHEWGIPDPVFEYAASSIVVTLRKGSTAGFAGEKLGVKLGEKLGVKLGENERRILEILRENKFLIIEEIAKKIGVSTTAIENNISKLKAKGILKHVGPDKNGNWEILL